MNRNYRDVMPLGGTRMNDPNDTDDDGLLEDLEAEFVERIGKGEPRAVAYAIQVAAPLWAARELPKRIAEFAEMRAEWAQEGADEADDEGWNSALRQSAAYPKRECEGCGLFKPADGFRKVFSHSGEMDQCAGCRGEAEHVAKSQWRLGVLARKAFTEGVTRGEEMRAEWAQEVA
jgi:hypothetical protein